ncbi:MAG: hypothetical protein WD971_01725 [Pirellulales bacterium]
MPLHPAEEATIRAFIVRDKSERYLSILANEKRRGKFLDCLNHCRDFDTRFATEIASSLNVVSLLQAHGAPAECNLLSNIKSLDGRDLLLTEAVEEVDFVGFGTLICCIPGDLALYVDEAGTGRRLLLERSSDKKR